MTRRLPNDVARCPGTRCEVREACARYMDRGDGGRVVQLDFSALGMPVLRVEQCEDWMVLGARALAGGSA